MREIDGCDVEKFGTLDGSDETIAILGDRWWTQTVKEKGDKISKEFNVMHGRNVLSVEMLEVSTLGAGTVLRLERHARSTVK